AEILEHSRVSLVHSVGRQIAPRLVQVSLAAVGDRAHANGGKRRPERRGTHCLDTAISQFGEDRESVHVRGTPLIGAHPELCVSLGMGTDKGRTSNVNGLAILAELTDRSIEAV